MALNKRLPKGRTLPGYGIECFNQLAAQCLMFPDLERFAWNLHARCYRARCYEVVGQGWYDFYQHSGPPDDISPAKEAPSPTVVVANTPAGTLSSHILMMPAPQAPPPMDETKKASHGDASVTATLRADWSVLLSDLQRLRSTIQAREEKRSDISR